MDEANGLRRREFRAGRLAGALLLLTAFANRAVEAQTPEVLHGRAAVHFSGSSTLHGFSGTGTASEFTLKANDKSHWNGDVEVPVAGLDTGNGWRDDGMRDMFHAKECPTLAARFADLDPAAVEADGHLSFALTICKVTRPVVARVTKWKRDAASAGFTADFDVSLASFGLEAPRTLFVKVADTVHVSVQATLRGD